MLCSCVAVSSTHWVMTGHGGWRTSLCVVGREVLMRLSPQEAGNREPWCLRVTTAKTHLDVGWGWEGAGAPGDKCLGPRRLQTTKGPPSLPGLIPLLCSVLPGGTGASGHRVLAILGKGQLGAQRDPAVPTATTSQVLIPPEPLGPMEAADKGLFLSLLVTHTPTPGRSPAA